jgi:hypothetical protein
VLELHELWSFHSPPAATGSLCLQVVKKPEPFYYLPCSALDKFDIFWEALELLVRDQLLHPCKRLEHQHHFVLTFSGTYSAECLQGAPPFRGREVEVLMICVGFCGNPELVVPCYCQGYYALI